jgi:hypothetical protein
MAFLRPHTANLTPHPAPVAPLAGQRWLRALNGVGYVLCLSALADRYSDVCASVSLVCDLALREMRAIMIMRDYHASVIIHGFCGMENRLVDPICCIHNAHFEMRHRNL